VLFKKSPDYEQATKQIGRRFLQTATRSR